MKSIYYWTPFTSKVATIEAVINSAEAINKYSKKYEATIINAIGEFDEYQQTLKKKKINVINLQKYSLINILPKRGFILSRIAYLIIFFISFIPLFNLLKVKKPDYLLSHLITSLPLFIFFLSSKKTKLILRISGLPKLTLLRKFFWKISKKNIYKIFCPTQSTMNYLINENIFSKDKIYLLRDPIINVEKLRYLQKESINKNELTDNFFVCIGRLTKQKNFSLVIDNYDKILEIDNNLKLYIIGDGECYKEFKKKIDAKKLYNKIQLLGYKKNVYKYLKKAKFFLLTSLWEDPGWVLIEAAANNTPIISSNCKNGPPEFIEKNSGGILFENNKSDSLIDAIKKFYQLSNNDILKKKIFSKKKSILYSSFRHYKNLEKSI